MEMGINNENNNLIKSKAQIALNEGLKAIICIGETLKERETGITLDIIKKQLLESLPQEITGESIIIAYEPVWAIGTGLTPSIEQITEVLTDNSIAPLWIPLVAKKKSIKQIN